MFSQQKHFKQDVVMNNKYDYILEAKILLISEIINSYAGNTLTCN